MPDTTLYAGVLPTLDMYESIDRLQKPVIASVNGYAVGGGNVLQVMCDITIAKESAVFRQVGPMMGSFDAGFGTWYLEDLVGKKKAKEIWFRNPRLSAQEALEIGMINKVVPDDQLAAATREMALEIAERGAFALASIKTAFSARHGGVGGLARLAHDLLLRSYLDSEESHELGEAFAARRKPDPEIRALSRADPRGSPMPEIAWRAGLDLEPVDLSDSARIFPFVQRGTPIEGSRRRVRPTLPFLALGAGRRDGQIPLLSGKLRVPVTELADCSIHDGRLGAARSIFRRMEQGNSRTRTARSEDRAGK